MKTKTRYTIGWLLWLAAFLALEGTALFNTTVGDTLSEHTWDWFRVFAPHPGPVAIGARVVLGLFLLWLLFHLAFGWFTPSHPLPHIRTLAGTENPMTTSDRWRAWLKRDAINRAARTFWHSVIAAGLVAAADAAVQVVAHALAAKTGGETVAWHEVANAAKLAAATALFAPLVAYLHRMRLDPSSVPSLSPPEPPAGQP